MTQIIANELDKSRLTKCGESELSHAPKRGVEAAFNVKNFLLGSEYTKSHKVDKALINDGMFELSASLLNEIFSCTSCHTFLDGEKNILNMCITKDGALLIDVKTDVMLKLPSNITATLCAIRSISKLVIEGEVS